jgi:peptidoglycan/LPS O-acetylase OafA/YrhL
MKVPLNDLHLILRILQVTVIPSFEALGFALLMLQSVFLPDWGIYRVLNWRWVCQIGVLSYSIYIWQQIFCTEPEKFGLGPVWWMSFPGWLVPVFVVSFISYYGLERPILKLRVHFSG